VNGEFPDHYRSDSRRSSVEIHRSESSLIPSGLRQEPRREVFVKKRAVLLLASVAWAWLALAQSPPKLAPAVQRFVSVNAPVVALQHVLVIDGTGAAPAPDQTIIIAQGRIQAMGSSAQIAVPDGAKVLDLRGHTVIPGLVGMHDHLFYPSRAASDVYLVNEIAFSAPRLYLACGVTTIRTAGAVEPYTDLKLKKLIEEGKMIGPKIHVTGPYLEGPFDRMLQAHELRGPEDARKFVAYWADQGVTSFKAYMHVTRAELAAAIDAAHQRGLKVMGHVCSVGFREAAALGIDSLEHGLEVDAEFVPGKAEDVCPPDKEITASLAKLSIDGPEVRQTIRELVRHHVAVTSTLAILETYDARRAPIDERVLRALLPQARSDYLTARTRLSLLENTTNPAVGRSARMELQKEMAFERAFAKAGGLLLAGSDPTGYGGVLPGFGNQREIELLVKAGFTPVEALHIATANGAEWLGESSRIGTLAPGKQADLVVVRGDPSVAISALRNVETVFKDGIGYDSAGLILSVRGLVGLF
jgi:imidazolonepropionase-like amidohydrolase